MISILASLIRDDLPEREQCPRLIAVLLSVWIKPRLWSRADMDDPALTIADPRFLLSDLEQEHDSRCARRFWMNVLIFAGAIAFFLFGARIMPHAPYILALMILVLFGILMDQISKLHIKRVKDQINQITYMMELKYRLT